MIIHPVSHPILKLVSLSLLNSYTVNTKLQNIDLSMKALPVVQLYPVQPAVHEEHDPSVRRHVSGLQFGEHIREQFVPKYPSSQARGQNIHKRDHK